MRLHRKQHRDVAEQASAPCEGKAPAPPSAAAVHKLLLQNKPRREGVPTLHTIAVENIGRHFLCYYASDAALCEVFTQLPGRTVSAISRAASRHAAVTHHNVRLFSHTGADTLVLRGDLSDEDIASVLPSPVPQEPAQSWEADMLELQFRGCTGLRRLYISSPLLTGAFLPNLIERVPTMTALGMQGCLDAETGPSFLLSLHLLSGLRELDVSCCSWFTNQCLRRLAWVLGRDIGEDYWGRPAPSDQATEPSMEGAHVDAEVAQHHYITVVARMTSVTKSGAVAVVELFPRMTVILQEGEKEIAVRKPKPKPDDT
ncbi:unnamed protein product [Chrysoparadoxa australica]